MVKASINDLKTAIDNYNLACESIRSKLISEIMLFPDNPDIKRMSSNCFTINSSNLSNSVILSPFYYDFKAQHEVLITLVNNLDYYKLVDMCEKMEKGFFKTPACVLKNHHGIADRIMLNPQVVERFKGLL